MAIKTKIKKKGLWKKILLFLIIGLTAITSVTCLLKITGKETTRTLSRLDYAIASIDSTSGKQIESNQNIVTKDFLSVKDMEIKLSDDATISYRIVFYDAEKKMLASGAVTDSKTVDFDEDDFTALNKTTAKYFKVVVTPAQVDGNAVNLNVFNVGGYINQITISCHK